MMKFDVEAYAPLKVFAPAPSNETFPSAAFPTGVPVMLCAEAPSNVVVPLPAVIVPERVRFAATKKLPEGSVNATERLSNALATERYVGPVTAPDVASKRSVPVVVALARNTLTPLPYRLRLLKPLELPVAVVIVPESVCAELLAMRTEPLLCVNVALLRKLPLTDSSVEGAVTAPEPLSIKKFVVEAEFDPKLFVAPPRKTTSRNWPFEAPSPVSVPEMLCEPEVPLKLVVPLLLSNVPLCVKLPAIET